MKLSLLVLKTPRMEELKEFYSSLGTSFQREQHGKGPLHYSAVLGGDLVLEIYPCSEGVGADSSLRLGLSVQDIQEALQLVGQGSVIPRQTQWGMRAVVKDPDGRAVELVQSRKAEEVLAQV